MNAIFIGTAGWAIRTEHHSLYDPGPSHLARYATRFSAVEINSSFYRPHRQATYERWAMSVPPAFRFAVKLPRRISHEKKLLDCGAELETFAAEISGLGEKLGVVLVQLPPKLSFDADTARRFFARMRENIAAPIACEPRHASWFTPEADALLFGQRIARATADPALVDKAAHPSGAPGLAYWRLHGSPRMYYSEYGPERLGPIAAELRRAAKTADAWCIFDNTARGAAVQDAMAMQDLVRA
jgi:uncharacterized protein YecE (DUF72 family)